MRVLLPVLLAMASACTPEITSGAYICGPDSSCPEDLVCNGPDNLCVLPSQVQPFGCDGVLPTQQEMQDTNCVSLPVDTDGCILSNNILHWVTFVAPTTCASGVEVQTRLAFPVAFAELGLELWDVDANTQLATDGECTAGAETGNERRCLDHELVPGTKYRIDINLTGEGTCDGACPYNRYFLRVQFGTPD